MHPTTRTSLQPLSLMTGLAMLACSPGAPAQQAVAAPPNAPATVAWNAAQGKLTLQYHGTVILNTTVRAEDAAGIEVAGTTVKLEQPAAVGEKGQVEQRLKFTLAEPKEGVKLVMSGTAVGSGETFPAETGSEAQQRFPLVRTSVGLSHSLRNNALYDRHWDWMLAGPADGTTRVRPKVVDQQGITFGWEIRPAAASTSPGPAAIELVFRPRYYQKHKDLVNFEPWTYQVWQGSVSGYCSWWSYRDGINQKVVDSLVDVFAAKKLPDFGYQYLQLDAGYCGGGGGPQSFLEWDKNKFPGGAQAAVKKIKSGGMKPGIWVHRVYRSYVDRDLPQIGKDHPDWFVTKEDGSIYQGGYGVWCLNTKNQNALDALVRPLFRELKQQAWDYVKIDGAGDMMNSDREQPAAAHFKRVGSTPEESLRNWDRVAREELGKDIFILTCWGVGPGRASIGLADGCRLGSDGFQWNTLLGNSSTNGVVWRGDPDHCDIMATGAKDKTTMKTFGVPAATADTIDQPCVVAMAGSMLMVSDKAEDYQNDANLEGMKRSAPVLFTVPGQLYDGGGNGTWWLQEIDRPFDHWSVLARFNWRQGNLQWKRPDAPEQEVKFTDLGLADDREYLVFEFWTQTFLGKSKGSFKAPALGSNAAMQVFAIREARTHPWVLSTTRHLSQGGVSLLGENWDQAGLILSGKSAVVGGDPYVLTVHLPAGFMLTSAVVTGEKVELAKQAETATVRIVPATTKTVEWKMSFAKSGGSKI
ncbi:MAG: alpha-galactosidase [Verrucomicrobia bacterium]|nr:alpha-galactosidase [Verrucomicrobiota bacterium]